MLRKKASVFFSFEFQSSISQQVGIEAPLVTRGIDRPGRKTPSVLSSSQSPMPMFGDGRDVSGGILVKTDLASPENDIHVRENALSIERISSRPVWVRSTKASAFDAS